MIKVAVIGFGHIGRRHATILDQYPETEVVAIADVNEELQYHELYPQSVPYYRGLEELLENENPDVVHVCTPNGFHASHALLALDKKAHVVIEKPMGLTKESCEKVIHKALQVNRTVFVVKQNRYSPPSQWLKKMVDEKILGEVCMLQINCYWNRDERYYKQQIDKRFCWKGSGDLDGGTLFTQFSHFVDILYWIFGDIEEPKSHFMDFNHKDSTEFEDSGVVTFKLANGAVGSLNFSTAVWDRNMESSLTVIGTKGSVKIGGQYMNEVEYCHVQDYELEDLKPTNPPNDYGPFTGSAANHHYVIENMVDVLNGYDVITANALEGMKVVDIIERIYRSAPRPIKKLSFQDELLCTPNSSY